MIKCPECKSPKTEIIDEDIGVATFRCNVCQHEWDIEDEDFADAVEEDFDPDLSSDVPTNFSTLDYETPLKRRKL